MRKIFANHGQFNERDAIENKFQLLTFSSNFSDMVYCAIKTVLCFIFSNILYFRKTYHT